MFKNVHPSPTGGKKTFRGKDKQDWAGVKGNESRWVYCRHCGFPIDTEQFPRGDEGVENDISYTTSSYTHPVVALKTGSSLTTWGSAVVYYVGDPTVHSGCPFCGSKNY